MRATVTKIANSTGVILPKAAADRLKAKQGDVVFLTETPTGYTVTPYDPEFAAQMEVARRGIACSDGVSILRSFWQRFGQNHFFASLYALLFLLFCRAGLFPQQLIYL
jgi:uncharacterized membrane protein YesL